jgi:hypothetical protein
MSQGESLCSVCSRPISGGEVLYTAQGNLICPGCNARIDLQQTDLRAAKNITNSAISSLMLGLFSFFINPFFIITVMSVSGGIYALRSLGPSNHRFAQHVESKRGLIYVCAIAGLIMSALNVIGFFLGFAGPRR